MKKTLISEVAVTNPASKISYYLIQDEGNFGVEIRKDSGETAQSIIPGKYEQTKEFILKLAENAALPEILDDCAKDYITEEYLQKFTP